MKTESDGTRRYEIKRRKSKNSINDNNIIPYIDNSESDTSDIRIFVLYHEKDKVWVENMEKSLEHKRIRFVNGIEESDMDFNDRINVVEHFDYLVVIISKDLLNDLDLLDIVSDNFEIGGKNEKIVPIIVWEELYEPEIKADVTSKLRNRIGEYYKKYFDGNFNGDEASELSRMQKIESMLGIFLKYALKMDKKRNLSPEQKLVKFVECYRKEAITDRIISRTDSGEKYSERVLVNNNYSIQEVKMLNVLGENGVITNVQNDN